MTDDPSVSGKPTLPPGETDPNRLYNAVGRAIHAWENMEEALARLYALMTGLPEQPDALSEYGSENRKFVERLAALKTAGENYFVSFPNQLLEGRLGDLLKEAKELSIKRHRIAHGLITMWGEFQIPDTPGPFEIPGKILYRWGAPWYSKDTLRTDPVGNDASSIEIVQKEFESLHNRVFALTSEMPRRP